MPHNLLSPIQIVSELNKFVTIGKLNFDNQKKKQPVGYGRFFQ